MKLQKVKTPPWLLGKIQRSRIRNRLRRIPAFSVGSEDRKTLRQTYGILNSGHAELIENIRVLPVSTLEWSSECRLSAGVPVVIYDIEQVNSLNFLHSLTSRFERPIFHQTEYLIRASESLLASGNIEASILCARHNYQELKQYAERSNTYPVINRPWYYGEQDKMIDEMANIIPAFVLSHEVGHAVYRKNEPQCFELKNFIRNLWEDGEMEPSRFSPAQQTSRFQLPDIVFHINEHGRPGRLAIRGTDKMSRMPDEKETMLEENFADYFAFYTTTIASKQSGLEPERLFNALYTTLENAERLLLLRRIIGRLPDTARTSAVRFESSKLRSRLYGILALIRESIKENTLIHPEVTQYWKKSSENFINFIQSSETEDFLIHNGDRSEVFCRAGVHVGLGGELNNEKTRDERLNRYKEMGPLAGNMIHLHAHGEVPSKILDISKHDQWTTEKNQMDPSIIGFACAVSIVSSCVTHHEQIDSDTLSDYDVELRSAKSNISELSMAIRKPRIIARWQEFND